MPKFTYSATQKDGKIVKGEREAENEKALATQLKAEGLFLLEVKEAGKGGLASIFTAGVDLGELISRLKPISLVEKMFFTRNLGVMVEAGLSLTKALEALKKESGNPKFKKVIEDITGSVIKGKTLAESLRIHQQVFGDLYINMVEAGEASGKLTLVLKLLANQMKKDHDLKKRVKGALMYPAVIIFALFIIGILMMIYVVPTLTQTIKELGVPLPITTQAIIFISDFVSAYALWVLLGVVIIGVSFWRALKTKKGKEISDHLVLKLPLFGSLVKNLNVARFCRTLSYLMTSGIPIVKSLEICASVLGNTLFKAAAQEAATEIQKGKQLHQILEAYPALFPELMIAMLSVGEETGKISSMVLRLAMFFEEDVNNTTKNLSTLIEPILMLVIGGAVGVFAVSMLQPIYSSLGNI